jgi:hypothetical protein
MKRLEIYRTVAVNVLGMSPEVFERNNARVFALSPGAKKMMDEEIPFDQLPAALEDCLAGLSLALQRPQTNENLKKAMDHLQKTPNTGN